MKKCIYLVEGECEEKLVKALREKPELVIPGKIRKFNVVQDKLPLNMLVPLDPGSLVIMVFDTDTDKTEILKNNLKLLKNLSRSVEALTIAQVLNFEDEIKRSTDVSSAPLLTKSTSTKDFKAAVNRMKESEFRSLLKRHRFDIKRLWTEKPPKTFNFVNQNGNRIKQI